MKGLASRLQQALIGRIADQRVLEQIGGVRRRAAAKHQLGLDQSLDRVGEFGLRQRRERGDRAVVEGAADHGGGLRHLLDRLAAGRAAPSANRAASSGSRARQRPSR